MSVIIHRIGGIKMEIIRANRICKSFDGRSVLKDISFSVNEGEIFGLIGPSGAGKTTLMNILTGQIKPDSGEAFICNRLASKPNDEFYLSMGIVFDTLGLFDRLNGYRNLEIFAEIYGSDKKRIPEVLTQVGLDPKSETTAFFFSKGMRQRLAIARAILHKPKILFLDEPTSGLDPAAKEDVHKLMLDLKSNRTTVFLTTHKMDEAYKLCDRIMLINKGIAVENDTPFNICSKYNADKKIEVALKDGSKKEFNIDAASAEEICLLIKGNMIESIHSTEPNLEEVFLKIAKGGASDLEDKKNQSDL